MYHRCVPLTILVVEDEPDLRDLIAETLTDEGYTVVTSGDGLDAVAQAERQPEIHLVLIDVQTPGLSAADVLRRLRQRSPDVKVLYMSGRARDEVITDFDRPDAPFLRKPFGLSVLTDSIRQLMAPA
jgi:two-component system, cell cycle sensor histidine kinase and response regulator CckA